ncbi:hypothetical protein Poli38472_014542 [Pythium oligandrum]|uniref:Vacuolar protein sorting-associated protein n=1 Tax=Pythium oligandrum TaxID=41045 RepID=A0A8K1FFZ1_PYTOL|nr:hypothetical protein Poli38472_014542 [Pythium oligandrum]|eukprot:TMW61081.1 hypothetical protein Poli38472_014542 [Pythium oligandrum]
MFLQRYVHVVLDAVLGRYVKNIDPEALKIHVWNGKIQVDVVELQPDAFPLPPELRIVKGTLHQLQIELPWSNLANQPIRVDIQDVSLLMEVCDRSPTESQSTTAAQSDDPRRKADSLRRKRATLDAIEKATQFKSDEKADANANTSQWTQGLVFKLLAKVLDNVQLNIQHIHLRLEDRVSDPARPFAVGITLESMIIKSADEGWNYTMMVRSGYDSPTAKKASFLRKKVDINRFGLYWSLPLAPLPQSAIDDEFAFVKLMQSTFWSPETTAGIVPKLFQPSDYVIQPLTLSLKLTINDGNAKLPISHPELSARVMARLGTPWMVETIGVIGDKAWSEFVRMMPRLAGDRQYSLSFVFSEAWSVARELADEEDAVPTVNQFKDALASCLQWAPVDVDRLEPCILKYRDAVVHVMEEKSTYIDASASIDRINVELQRSQYASALSLMSFLGMKRRLSKYAHLRPTKSQVRENPRRWWRYAIDSVLVDVRERLAHVDWEQIRQMNAKRARYQELYLLLLHGPALPSGLVSPEVLPLSKDAVRAAVDELELEMDIQTLFKLRNVARQKLAIQKSKTPQKPSQPAPSVSTDVAAPPASSRLWSYTSSWLYGANAGEAQSAKTEEDTQMEWSDQDTRTLFAAINFNPDEVEGKDEDSRSDQHIWYRFHLGLATTRLRLVDDKHVELLSAALDRIDSKLLIRPSSVEVSVQLGNAFLSEVAGRQSSNSHQALLVERMNVDEIIRHHPPAIYEKMSCVRLRHCERELPLIDISVEVQSLKGKRSEQEDGETNKRTHNVAVCVVTQAIKCHVNAVALLRIASFFSRPRTVDLSGLDNQAWRQAQRLQQYSTAQLRAAVARRSKIDLLIDVVSPVITVTESPQTLQRKKAPSLGVVVFLGHLRATSRDKTSAPTEQKQPEANVGKLTSKKSDLSDHLYDIVDIGVSGIEVRLNEGEMVSSDLSQISSTYLLEKTAIQLGFYVSITPDDPRTPLIKLTGGLDSVTVNLSSTRFGLLMQLLRSIAQDVASSREIRQDVTSTTSSVLSRNDSARAEYRFIMGSDSGAASDRATSPTENRFHRLNRSASSVRGLYGVITKVLDHDEREQPKDVNDKDLIKLWKRVIAQLRFRIRDVVVNLEVETPDEASKSIRLRASDIKVELNARTYDKHLDFELGAFSVEETRQSKRDGTRSRFLIASGEQLEPVTKTATKQPAKSQLIRLSITHVDVEAPKPKDRKKWKYLKSDFVPREAQYSVWQDALLTTVSIDASLHTLTMNLHQDAFADLFLFFFRPGNAEAPAPIEEPVEPQSPPSETGGIDIDSPEPHSPAGDLTKKIGTWVTSSLIDNSTMNKSFEGKRSDLVSVANTSNAAAVQVRLQVTGLSVVLHKTQDPEESDDSTFVKLVAKDFAVCIQRFPQMLSVFAYLKSMNISDQTVPDPALREILAHGSEETRSTFNVEARGKSQEVGHIPQVDDILHVMNEVPAIFSCAAQLYGADRIQEIWHPGYSNRFSVRLRSPRIRVLYRFLDELREYFFDGILLKTVMSVLFRNPVQFAWDRDFLISTFANQSMQSGNASAEGSSNSTSELVSMFPLLDVRLADAILHVPVHRTSKEALVVRFDDFRLSNEYLLETFRSMANRVMAKVLLNSSLRQFKIDLVALRIVSVIFVEKIEWDGQIQPDLLTQSLLGSTTMGATADFTGNHVTTFGFEFSPLRVVCNREQYAFLLRLPLQYFREARRRHRNSQPDNVVKIDDGVSAKSAVLTGVGDSFLDSMNENMLSTERELLVTLRIPEISLEILHGQEGYQPSVSGDLSMAERVKTAQGSICSVDITGFSSSVNYGFTSATLRATADVRGLRIRDTRIDSDTVPMYRDVVVLVPSGNDFTPSISIRLLNEVSFVSDDENSLKHVLVSPRHRRSMASPSSQPESKHISSSLVGTETIPGLPHKRDAVPTSPVEADDASSMSFTSKTSAFAPISNRRRSSDNESTTSSRRTTSVKTVRQRRTDLIVEIEGFRVVPSNIHYDILRFIELPGSTWAEAAPEFPTHEENTQKVDMEKQNETNTPDIPQQRVVVSLALGRSAILLVEDPMKVNSRAVMFSWEAAVTIDFLRRVRVKPEGETTTENRLQVQLDINNIQATSRLSQSNMWERSENEGGEGAVGGDFLKPCDLECSLDVDSGSGFVRLKAGFDQILDLRFGYLDVCSILAALQRIVLYPVKPPTSSRSLETRRMSIGSSAGSSSAYKADFRDGEDTFSTLSMSRSLSGSRNSRRDRRREETLCYGTTLVHLVSATFRGPIHVRPAVGLYSSPWRKRYLVLPFTAQERQSVIPVIFRIIPASGSGRLIGEEIRYGDRIALQPVLDTSGLSAQGQTAGWADPGVPSPMICMYDQLGASGYLGPDGGAGVFETRVWKHGTSVFNSDRNAIRHKDAIVFEEVTVYRAFSKGKNYGTRMVNITPQRDEPSSENGGTVMVSDGGGYLMFNGVGDAPIPFVVSVVREETHSSRDQPDQSQPPISIGGTPAAVPRVREFWQNLKVIQFSLPGVNATVVNDFHNMLLPLLHFRVVQMQLDLRGVLDSRFSAIAGLQVGVQAYNSQLAVWEPLVEDFDVNVALHAKGGTVCEFCMSDRQQIPLVGTTLRCQGLPVCLFASSKTAVYAGATARASDTKHFIYQEILGQRADEDAQSATTCLVVIKKGINVNISRNGINVLLHFTDLVTRAASNAEEDAWRSRLGAYIYVDNQSGIPFMVASHPSPSSAISSSAPTSLDDAIVEDTVKLPALSVGSEDSLASMDAPALDKGSWNNRQLNAVFKDLMSPTTSWIEVADGERAATNVLAHEAPAGSITSPLRRLLWLRPQSLPLPSGGPAPTNVKPIPVPIGYSNRSYVHLESAVSVSSKQASHGERIICETVAEQGTLVMRLRGTVQIVNNLSSAVEVMYNEERRQVLQSGGNTAHFIPIQYLDNGSLTFCPMLRNGRLQRSASLSIASLLRAPATQSSQSGRWSQQKTTVARGALELRKVITFYWDVHPEHASDDSAFEDDFSVSRPPFQVILTVVRKSEKHETVFTISPPIRIENLVPYALAFRSVCVKSERDIQWVADNAASFSGTTGSVPSGSSSQVCELEIFSKSLAGKTDTVQAPAAVALSIAIPGIGCTAFSKWTEDSFIYGSRRQCRQIQIVPAEAVDHDIRAGKESVCPLQLQVEIVTTEVLGNEQLNILTPVICRIYVEYWLIDRTCLSLKMRTNDGRRIIPCPTESVESESNAPVALFSGDQKQLISTMKISVPDTSGGDIDSKAFDITTVGLRGQLTLRAADAISRGSRRRSLEEDASLRKQYDIGVMIEQGPSLFSRTTIVTFVPRYYFINNSNRFEIQVKQDGDEDANALVLAPKEGCFFHWNDYRLSNRVQLRFVCHEDCDTVVEDGSLFRDESFVHGVSEWSLPLEVSSVGNFVVRLQKALLQAPSFFCGACYQSDDTHGHTDAADAMKDQCEVLAGMPLHVGVELHDPALVVRFHEGNNTVSRDVRNTDIKDFIPFKLKNECTAFEMVVWQKIPADPEGRAFTFEGGERVLPFHTLDFVPYAASVAPTLYVQVQALFDPTTKGDREVDDTWLVMSHAAPRVVTTFEVSLNKLHRMPVLHVMDGKHKKRLWVEVMLDDATKTLHVTDVLPGSSSEHKRRRRAALIRSWKRYNAYIRWDSRHLSKSRLSKTIPEVDEDALREEETESKKKQVRFADEKTDEDLADTQSEEETVKEPSKDGNSRMETGNPFTLGVRVVECSHLEDLYPVQTNVASCSPFLRVDISGTAGEATCKVRSQSLAVAPRWLPLVGEKQSVDVLMCTGFIGADGKTSLDGSDSRQVEIEVREGNKIFGSSLLGRASLPLSSYLDAMRQSNESHHVFDILVPVLPVDKSSRSIQAVPSLRTMVRLQIACDISKQGEIGVPNGLRIQEAIKNYRVEHQLDRLVRCKSQLRVLLERESVDISVGEELNDSMATLGLANTGLPHGSRQFIPPILNRYHDSGTESVSSRRFDRITSEMTEDSASDLGFEQLGTERLLSVVLTGVAKLQIPSLQNQVNGADGVEPKVYCTVSYKNSTRSAISSVAKPSDTSASNRERKRVRTHTFRRGESLGLDLIYHSGRVVVQGVSCNGPCGHFVQDAEIRIGDTVVAVNGKSIVNLHRQASFRAIEQARSVVTSQSDAAISVSETFSLSFLEQTIVASRDMDSQDESAADRTHYEAEWNRRVEFVDSDTKTLKTDDSTQPQEKALVRVYLRNDVADHGISTTHESSVVPFLYFFGDDVMMDHFDHSKQETRFDSLLGECWVPVPRAGGSGWDVVPDDDPSKSPTDCVYALYAPHKATSVSLSTPREMVGQVRVALKWDYRSTGAKQKCDEELRAYLQLEVQGVFLSFVDDGLVPYANTQRPPREVLSVSLSARHADVGVQLCYGLISDGRHVINTRVGHLQVDNQLLDTNYPVMVYPLRLTDTAQQEQNDGDVEDEGTIRSGDSALLPTFQLMSVFSKRRSLFEVEYIFVQLQELDVKLEDAVLVATAQAFSGITWAKLGRQGIEGDRKRATAVGTAMSLVDARWPFPTTPVFPVSMLNVEHRGGNMKVLLRWMLLCPIKVNVTFTSTTDRSNLLSLVSPEMSTALRSLISAAAALVSNLDQALIKIPEFYVENLLETTHTLAFYAMQHYLNHGLRSWYRIVGSVDVLGNPIGLVSALGAGVKDFFYTPAQMLLEDEKGLRIENLRTGMTKGSKSLLRNTAVGIFHTTGKITETLGKGVALLAMDDQYNVQRQRETIKQKKRINDLGDAIAEGGKGLVGGVWDGLKGVVEAPVRGAERDGAGGFVVGIGQGFAGLIVKPTAGFLDMLTSLSRGAKSSAEAIDGDGRGYAAVTRVRLPRRICSDGVLVSYSEREARGCAILALTSLDATDDYVFHLDYGIDAQRGILLLTDKRVICLSSKSGQKLWEVALDSSLVVDGSAAFLSIGQSKASNKVYKIECDDTTAASNFKLAVASARMDLSATRYLLLNLEQKQDQARNNALRGIESEDEQRVDLNLLMGNLQDTMVTGLTDEDLQTQPLRSVQVEVCHLENKDAVANVPKRAMISFQLFLSFSVFQIIVYGGPYQWTIYRRFSEFRDLYAALEKSGHDMEALPPIPPRTFLPSTRSNVATYRQDALSVFLQAAIMHSSISGSPPMLEFLTRSPHEVRVSLPPLSPGVSSNVPRARARTNDGDRISEDDRAETSSAIEIREQIPMSL